VTERVRSGAGVRELHKWARHTDASITLALYDRHKTEELRDTAELQPSLMPPGSVHFSGVNAPKAAMPLADDGGRPIAWAGKGKETAPVDGTTSTISKTREPSGAGRSRAAVLAKTSADSRPAPLGSLLDVSEPDPRGSASARAGYAGTFNDPKGIRTPVFRMKT
jgi:hypothetical protein